MDRSNLRREGAAPPAPEPLPAPAVDSHTHLDLVVGEGVPAAAAEVAAVVAAARAAGVARLVTIGIDLPTSHWAVAAAAAHDGVRATVAIHPNEAARGATDDELAALEALARRPEVVAVGETGLDHYRTTDAAARRRQEESFRRHVDIAKRTGRTLVIHDRDAHDDVLRVLRAEGAPERVVLHCFSGDAAFARACVDAGYACSFAGNVTFASAAELRAAAAAVPDELLLVETDAPFLTPVPFRGRPNTPALAAHTVRTLAEVRVVTVEEVCAAVTATADRFL